MTLYQALCTIFSARQDGSASITDLMRIKSLRGQIDEPRKIAILTELLNRVAEIEKKIEESVLSKDKPLIFNDEPIDMDSKEDVVETFLNTLPHAVLSWTEIRNKAKELGVFKPGLKRSELEALIASKSNP